MTESQPSGTGTAPQDASLRLVAFDLGGTVIVDQGYVVSAFRDALAHHGLAIDDETLRRWRGAAKRDLEAGWHAGARVNIGVRGGAHTEAQLRTAPHTHILPTASAVVDVLRYGVNCSDRC